jgi:hypothetical protein
VQRCDNSAVVDGLSSGTRQSKDGSQRCLHLGGFSAAVSAGSFRKRLSVAARIALVTAGTTTEVRLRPRRLVTPGSGR